VIKSLIPQLVGKALYLSSIVAPKWSGDKALDLFCTPRKGSIKEREHKFLTSSDRQNSFQTKFGKVQYYIWNSEGEKTILLLHGWESNAARWRSLIKSLSDSNYRIIALDAPGHGASSNKAFDMLQYIEAINFVVKEFKVDTMIGHSVGGASICFYFSRFQHPTFDQIILLGSPTELSHMVNGFYNILDFPSRLKRIFEFSFENKFGLKVSDISTPKMVKDVEIPTLIIHDKKDEVIPVEHAKVYSQLFINSTTFITDGYGHGLQSKEVFYKIKSFLESAQIIN